MSDWTHLVSHLFHADSHHKHGSQKAAGVAFIIVGLFLTPFLIGIPLIIYGIYKLFK